MRLKPIVIAGGGATAVFTVGQVVIGIRESCSQNPECATNAVAFGLVVAALLGLRLGIKVFTGK